MATVTPTTDYSGKGAVSSVGSDSAKSGTGYWDLGKLRRAYNDYLSSKRDEIDEQKDSRRYYHGSQWTDEQIKILKKRKQPIVTYNRISRKIDGVVGLLERLRQDPKAFPRTPQHEQGADLATAVLRYVLDQQDWKAKSPLCARDGAIDGIGGIEIELETGDRGDPEIGFSDVDIDGFFYDPRSFKEDFSDARYMGMGKWLDIDTAKEMFPDQAAEIDASVDNGDDLSTNSDREAKWFYSDSGKRRLRLVDCWYRHDGKWCYSIFTGSTILAEGESFLVDEKNQTFCKFVMFSGNVDHDGDRYGFIRNLRSAQNEINQRRSKALHMSNSRRLIVDQGAVDDIEKVRKEWARPDGVILKNPGGEVAQDNQVQDIAGQFQFFEDAKGEIENFGPNPALIGQGVENKSGRAIALMQQAGMAELGPFMLAYKNWKIRVYRAIWNAVQRHWTGERWIRVTDDQDVAQFIQINGMGVDPQTGMPTIVNALGSLDVDIILDESPDSINLMQDVFETLKTLIPATAAMLTPPQAQAALKLLIDTSPLPAAAKKAFSDASKPQQPDPMAEQAKQVEMAGAVAKVQETQSRAALNAAKARKEGAPEMQGQEPQVPMDIQARQAIADINETEASAMQKRANAAKTMQDTLLAPVQLQIDQQALSLPSES